MDARLKTLKRSLEAWAVWGGFKLVRSLLTCVFALCGQWLTMGPDIRVSLPQTLSDTRMYCGTDSVCVCELLLVM